MSLLNDMLRDLSQHKPVADGAEGYDDALLHSSTLAQKKQQPWIGLLILFVVIFVAVLALHYFFHKKPNLAKPVLAQTSNKANLSADAANTSSLASTLKPESVPPVVHEEIKTEPQDSPSENPFAIELQNHIDDLLQQADRAIGMDRLTAPVEDNAYGYYQKILGMSPDNTDAKDGLDKIASRYLMKAQEQIKLGNPAQADALIQRARFVSARYVQAHEISLNEMDSQQAPAINTQASVAETQTSNQPVQTTETVKSFEVAEAPVISVAPNAGWKDEQLAQHAQELAQQGKQTEAITLLKNFIATEQKPALSTALLGDLYIQQGNVTAAEIVVEKATYLAVDAKTKLKAQILSANGDDVQAIALLEKNLSDAENNEAYRSLLASLYHKTANYQQSIISYQRLINSFGEKPAYWLGLALAYDGLSQHKSALQAYKRLREYPQLQEQVKKYTDQRIAALGSE